MNTQRLSQLIFLFERIGGNELTLAAAVARKAVEEMEEKDLTPGSEAQPYETVR
ncbi:hypothetical protein Q4S22_11810 [Morganella morganii]